MNNQIKHCVELVRASDPERFLSAMSAPPKQRGALMVIYAFNLEIARIPWVTQEPMIAEMRLQWWRDMIEGIFEKSTVPDHEVGNLLAGLVERHNLPRSLFDRLIDARGWDIYREAHHDMDAFDRYLKDTAGCVLELGCRVLGDVPDRDAVIDYGFAHGVSLLLRAFPALQQRGRIPLIDSSPQGVVTLAQRSLKRADGARRQLKSCPNTIRPALRSAWNMSAILNRALKDPGLVAAGGLEPSQGFNRMSLLRKSMMGGF